MGNSLSVRLHSVLQNSNEDSWLNRVKDNARAFFDLRKVAIPGGAGAFDLLEERPEPGTRQRQASSLLLHVVVIGILLLLSREVVHRVPKVGEILRDPGPYFYSPPEVVRRAEKPGSGNGSGGHNGPLPPTAGQFAARSQVVLLHPRVPDEQPHVLPVEPTVFDANANEMRHVPQLGLPYMKDRNRSNGPGDDEGIGNKHGHTMGTNDGDDEGESETRGSYMAGGIGVKCVYCPDPEYTDEARKEKLQGTVTLRVLVTADGRVGRVKIIKGLGLGLDERAMDAVRQWRFEPARDAGRHAIPEWVTVETTYRLF
jgi:periplasmic protein TonB